jgi:hypothetical protein
MDATIQQNTFTVSIPTIDTKMFKQLVQRMGWQISKTRAEQRVSMFDPESGQYLNDETMQAIEESRKGVGVTSYSSFEDFANAMRTL